MKKILSAILAAMLVFAMFGCGTEQEQTTQTQQVTVAPTEEVTPVTTAPEETTVAVPENVLGFDNIDMVFLSGAGAWSTEFTLSGDGSFFGFYHDSEMGEVGEDYPQGTQYVSRFNGTFGNIEKINEYTYSMELITLNTDEEVGKEWVEDGVKYIASDAHGFVGKEFKLYTKNAPIDAIPEEVAFWISVRGNDIDGTLGYYVLENVSEGFGMFEVTAD